MELFEELLDVRKGLRIEPLQGFDEVDLCFLVNT